MLQLFHRYVEEKHIKQTWDMLHQENRAIKSLRRDENKANTAM